VDKDTNERMPLLPHVPTKVEKDNGETSVYSHFVCHDELRYYINCHPFVGFCHHILHSFSMIRNIKTIMKTKVGESDLKYLHGIRVLSLFWIILLHTNFQSYASFLPYGK
jgi:hypothetical protein